MNFIDDLEQGIVNAIKADPDVAEIPITTSTTDDIKETLSAFVQVEYEREAAPTSRTFICSGSLVLRINRSQYSADEARTFKQNLFAALTNATKGPDGFDAFSYGTAKSIGVLYGAQNQTQTDEVEINVFLFRVFAYQLQPEPEPEP